MEAEAREIGDVVERPPARGDDDRRVVDREAPPRARAAPASLSECHDFQPRHRRLTPARSSGRADRKPRVWRRCRRDRRPPSPGYRRCRRRAPCPSRDREAAARTSARSPTPPPVGLSPGSARITGRVSERAASARHSSTEPVTGRMRTAPAPPIGGGEEACGLALDGGPILAGDDDRGGGARLVGPDIADRP